MDAKDFIKYCRSRFRIEFLNRVEKHHTGLELSQAKSSSQLLEPNRMSS